jgi:hypothetical protein
MLIGSSTSITVTGSINASGGNGYPYGSGGSGGAIRLVAPTPSGAGTLAATGGLGLTRSASGGAGGVRLEGFTGATTAFTINAGSTVSRGSPIDPSTLRPSSSGSLSVVSIGGVPVAANSSGSFTLPDVTINSTAPVAVVIQASGIPPGTIVTLLVYPQTPVDSSIVYLPPVPATLAGTLASSTATVAVAFPYGFSRGYLSATWTP